MRVWDISPGYLNRQSLLGEHRELHGLRSILLNGKTGYARHPETMRWVGCLSGLAMRHEALVAEMQLRGYRDATPVTEAGGTIRWPAVWVTPAVEQFALLAEKYRDRSPGRIALPRQPQQLWAQHKYSVMARDVTAYRSIGRRVTRMARADMKDLATELALLLRAEPPPGRVANALEHMWGHVRRTATPDERSQSKASAPALLAAIQRAALRTSEPYLLASTALSELAVFVSRT